MSLDTTDPGDLESVLKIAYIFKTNDIFFLIQLTDKQHNQQNEHNNFMIIFFSSRDLLFWCSLGSLKYTTSLGHSAVGAFAHWPWRYHS